MLKTRFLKTKILFIALLLLNAGVFAQVKTITGVVKDSAGKALPKASITAKGAAKSALSNDDGTFSITVPEATPSITISFSGYSDKIISIKGKTSVDVVLQAKVQQLEDVVVQTGYGTQRAKDVTGAISAVKGDAVKNLATQDVATALQGRVAGVEVVSASGQPGAGSQITIRGVSSLNNADPLYVIDGVQQKGPNPGGNINPQDVESYTVLKDASAAAIYGAAAAGGVIIITTKRGKGTKPTINFTTRYGITMPKTISLLDKNDFVRYKQDEKDPDYSNPANATAIASYMPVDWNKELYRNGAEQNYTLSISGASPSVDYFLSGVYNNQTGVFLDNSSSMGGVRVNTDVKVTNAIKIGEEMSGYVRNTIPIKTPIVSTPFESQPLYTGPLYSSTPGVAWGIYPFGYHGGIDAVAQSKTANFTFPSNSFQGQVYLEAKLPIRYLTFRATFGYTSQSYQNNLFQNKYTSYGTPLVDSTGTRENHLYRNIGNYEQTLNAYILAYDHTWGKHTINLLGGYEQYASTSQNLLADQSNVLSNNSYNYIQSSSSTVQGNTTVTGGYDPNGLVKSVFGRLNYDFNKQFFITGTVRRDANFTVFGQDNQAGIFPSVSGGWNIGDERFFKKYRRIVNQLKLRASYGVLGNSNIQQYSFNTAYNTGTVQNFTPGGASQVAYTQNAIANADIQWESTAETNIGVDGQMLDGKIYFTIDWYNKNTTKLLYNVPVSFSSGVPSGGNGFTGGAVSPGTFLENIGSVRNRGVDIALGYNGKAGKVNYTIGATGSFNSNVVEDLNTPNGLPDGNNNFPYGTSIWAGQSLTRTFPGYSFGQFWGLKTEGIYAVNDPRLATAPSHNGYSPRAGDLIYYDKNHNGIIDASDDTIIGNPYPKFTFGLNFTANWKGFDIALLFNGALGVQLYNGVTPYEFESLDGSNATSKVFQSSGFTNNGVTNGITKYPDVGYTDGAGHFIQDSYGNYTTPSSYFVENGNYVKLKNIQIGYTISNRFLQKANIKSIRIYVMANNLLTITKYTGVDPELGSQYATLGLDKNGNVIGNADGSTNYNPTGLGGATTSRGIDGPSKYPSVKLYAAGINVVF